MKDFLKMLKEALITELTHFMVEFESKVARPAELCAKISDEDSEVYNYWSNFIDNLFKSYKDLSKQSV